LQGTSIGSHVSACYLIEHSNRTYWSLPDGTVAQCPPHLRYTNQQQTWTSGKDAGQSTQFPLYITAVIVGTTVNIMPNCCNIPMWLKFNGTFNRINVTAQPLQ